MSMDTAEDREFGKHAYLSLADEFDPMGDELDTAPLEFVEADWDAAHVTAAREYAARYSLPLPWDVRSVDKALALTLRAELDEQEGARLHEAVTARPELRVRDARHGSQPR